MERSVFAKYFAVVLAAGLASFAGTVEAGIVGLDAPFTLDDRNFGVKYLNFDGTSLSGSVTQGSNSVGLANGYGNLQLSDGFLTVYAYNSVAGTPLTFSQGDVVSAASTTFAESYSSNTLTGPTYFVFGFYNNSPVTSGFADNSNLAWAKISYDQITGYFTIEEAGINTVAGGPITVGEVGSVPEIDPATGSSALSLVAGVLAMIEQRRRRAKLVA